MIRSPTFSFIENNSSKVLNAKLGLVVVLWWDVVCVEFVLKVELVQHGGVGTLKAAHTQNPSLQEAPRHLSSQFSK